MKSGSPTALAMLARAWQEGYESAQADEHEWRDSHESTQNPYRTDVGPDGTHCSACDGVGCAFCDARHLCSGCGHALHPGFPCGTCGCSLPALSAAETVWGVRYSTGDVRACYDEQEARQAAREFDVAEAVMRGMVEWVEADDALAAVVSSVPAGTEARIAAVIREHEPWGDTTGDVHCKAHGFQSDYVAHLAAALAAVVSASPATPAGWDGCPFCSGVGGAHTVACARRQPAQEGPWPTEQEAEDAYRRRKNERKPSPQGDGEKP